MFDLAVVKKQIKGILRTVKMSARDVGASGVVPFDTNSSVSEANYSFIIKSEKINKIRVNLLVPSINKEHRYGGITTAVSVFSEIAAELSSEALFRFLVTDKNYASEAVEYLSEKMKGIDFEVVDIGFNKIVPIAKSDVFVATAWWTAYLARELIIWKNRRYQDESSRLFYIVQDFEPGFYAWSSRYVLAESTYLREPKAVAIFNSSLLRDFFLSKKYAFEKSFFFEPRMSENLRKNRKNATNLRKRRIVFYGRPSAPRNCFEIIVDCLHELLRVHNEIFRDWEIVSVGEQHDDISIGNRIIRSYGKLLLSEYAELMNESAIGISLMLSPHPSYPPLEMAHFGMLTITNRYENKDLSSLHDNISSISIAVPGSLAEALLSAMLTFEEDPLAGHKGASHFPEYLLSNQQFPFVAELSHSILTSVMDI